MTSSLAIAVLIAAVARAATLPFQGLATDGQGNPAVDGTHAVAFFLYASEAGGTSLWSEEQSLSSRKGLFSAVLGSAGVIPDTLLKQELYLGVRIDKAPETARIRLVVPLRAARAGRADSADVSVRTARAALARNSLRADSSGFARASDSAGFASSAGQVDSAAFAIQAAAARASRLADTARATGRLIGEDSTVLRAAKDSLPLLSGALSAQRASLAALQSFLATGSFAAPDGIPWNTGAVYGSLTDPRDGQTYRTVTIGSRTWMAQNLNFRKSAAGTDTVGVCYKASVDSCSKYGRLYTWAETMAGAVSSAESPSGVQGLCPSGWHVPSDGEWTRLTDTALEVSTSGIVLKSTQGWQSGDPGLDTYGFRALPGGIGMAGNTFANAGSIGYWWTATQGSSTMAWYRSLFNLRNLARTYDTKAYAFSLRCVKD